MKSYKNPLLIISLLLGGFISLSKAGESSQTTGQQLLLLRNGETLAGQISRSGDVYHVVLPNVVIRIKAADVEMVCRDLEEGYRQKRAAIALGSLRDHLDLAQWCQRQKLYDHAAAELADAAVIAPENPMVGYLQRRLQMAAAPLPERSKAEIAEEPSPSNAELDRMIRGLPHKAVENFTQSVQPLLINNCTLSGCHGPQSETGLRLQRTAAGQPAGRRLTQRNIYAVMQYVDRNNPLASRILTVPIVPHGTAKTPVFTEQQIMQYKRLADWVMQLGPITLPDMPEMDLSNGPMLAQSGFKEESSAAAAPAILPSGATGRLQSGKETMPRVLSQDAGKARYLPPVAGSGVKEQDVIQTTYQEAAKKSGQEHIYNDVDNQRPKIKRGASLDEFTPRDDFDPEIFNRRYLKPTTSEKSPSTTAPTGGK